MKKTYTKRQITEAIAYWENILESMNEFEAPSYAGPSYSGNKVKNVHKRGKIGTQIPDQKYKIGMSVNQPLTVAQFLDELNASKRGSTVMTIQRKMLGDRANSTSLNNAVPYTLKYVKVGSKALILFGERTNSFKNSSTIEDIIEKIDEAITPNDMDKIVGIQFSSNRMNSIKPVYKAFSKDYCFYIESKQNTIG